MTTDTRAQGGVAAGADRRQDGHRHRHQQGRRHDPAEHGDDARLRRHRCGDRPALLQPLVREAADESFNRITIDGDTSTNDSFVLIATQQAGHAPIDDLDSRPTAARCATR